jgi:DnaJ-class molecular chaperone
MECPSCQGAGSVWNPKKTTCKRCGGKGFVTRTFIVKVQLSLATNHAEQQVLVYNKDKSVFWQDVAGEDIVKTMAGRPKAFFSASRNKKGVIEIGEEVSDPGWDS